MKLEKQSAKQYIVLNWNDHSAHVAYSFAHVLMLRSMAFLVLFLINQCIECQTENDKFGSFIHKRKPVRIIFYFAVAHWHM